MKVTGIFSVLLLGAMLTVCIAEPCYDATAFAAHKKQIKEDCKSEIDAVKGGKLEKINAGLECCLRKHGGIDGNNVVYDKLLKAATQSALEGKADVITAGYNACKDKFTTVDKLLEGHMCAFQQLKDKCSDIAAAGEKMKNGEF